MGNLYDRVSDVTTNLDKLREGVSKLQIAWAEARLDPFELVDDLYTTGEYVDNEFYKKLREVRANPDQISVLHLRSYDEELPSTFKNIWKEIDNRLGLSYSQHPVYDFARSIVDDVLPEFSAAFEQNPDRAYRELRRLVEQFVGEMQNSRFLLKMSTG